MAKKDEIRIKKKIPFEFVLEELAQLDPYTRPMFGCYAVYVGEKIVLILRDKEEHSDDNGVWLATTAEHHADLRKKFPSMRSIRLFGSGTTGWQVLPAEASDFEESVFLACELVKAGSPLVGKIPNRKNSSKKKKSGKKSKRPKRT